MRSVAATTLAVLLLLSCRPYENYGPLADQSGLLPAERFARLGAEQAQLVAVGRSLAAWHMTADADALRQQAARVACFARRLPDVATVDTDPDGFRVTLTFKSGWRAATIPIDDGVDPAATPGLPALLPAPTSCS